jgi:methyl-accepting chemotaxis protein
MFNTLKLSQKISLIFGVIILLIVFSINIISYFLFFITEKQSVIVDLEAQTEIVSKDINSIFESSIHSNLNGIAKSNLDIVQRYHQLFLDGTLTNEQMMDNIRIALLSQEIGETGYNTAISSDGNLVIHPKSEGLNISGYDFWPKMVEILGTEQQSGYFEYDWKNVDETETRPKAAWVMYYEPLDLIIWVSTYREEFTRFINKEVLRANLLSVKLRGDGYYYAVDKKGVLTIHPKIEGRNLYNSTDAKGDFFIQEILEKKNGTIAYWWQNPDELSAREKIAVFREVPGLDWIIIGSVYVEDLTSGLLRVTVTVIIIGLIFSIVGVGGVIFFSSRIARRITAPIKVLKQSIEDSDLTVRISSNSNDEIGQMAEVFNNFIENLHDMFRTIENQAVDINESSSELSKTADDFAQRSQRTAATAEEVTATIEEITASNNSVFETIDYQHKRTKVLIENINTLYGIVTNEGSQMQSANIVKTDLDSIIGTMKVKINETLEKMRESQENSKEMLGYISTIYDISEQINMLALNASIEAARAGDSGKGFAVVAEEIGKLASQVDSNTQNISNTMNTTNEAIDGSSNSLEETVNEMEKILSGLEQFGTIVSQVGDLTEQDVRINENLQQDAVHFLERADSIMSAIREEKHGITEIARSTEHLNEIAQNNSASSEELAATTEKLDEYTKILRNQINKYKL